MRLPEEDGGTDTGDADQIVFVCWVVAIFMGGGMGWSTWEKAARKNKVALGMQPIDCFNLLFDLHLQIEFMKQYSTLSSPLFLIASEKPVFCKLEYHILSLLLITVRHSNNDHKICLFYFFKKITFQLYRSRIFFMIDLIFKSFLLATGSITQREREREKCLCV